MQNLLTENDVAQYLGVTVAACRKWRFQKRGPAYLKLGNLVRYRPEDVDQWLSNRPQGGECSAQRTEITRELLTLESTHERCIGRGD